MRKNLFYIAIAAITMAVFTGCSEKEDNIPVTGVTVGPTTTNLTTGSTITLTVTVMPEDATNKAVTWISSSATVATVNNGLVTAVAPGTAIVTVTTQDGNKTAACTVTVTAATVPVTGVTLSPTTATLTTGGTFTLTATVLPANATNKAVTWTSSSATVATVNNGLVTAVAPGTAIVTVTTQDGNKTAACTVTVALMANQMMMITQKNSISLQVAGSGTMTINWGDGTNATTHTLSSALSSHSYTYTASSAHTIIITGENITALECSSNQLTALDVSKNTVLQNLWCTQNQLTVLDVSNNTALTILEFVLNQLTALDVSNNTALIYLNCSNNQLTTLNVSNNTALQTFYCAANQLTATALNALFGTLHSNTISGGKNIYIGGNSGTATCDTSIATAKGWTVYN